MIMIEVCEVRGIFASIYVSGSQHEFCSGKLQLYTSSINLVELSSIRSKLQVA